MKKIITIISVLAVMTLQAQTVTDYDGNIYDVIQIGDQFWLQQNLKSLHYSDGTVIPDVLSYENNDSLAVIYGRLYTWDAAMHNTTTPMAQGVCPEGWHLPSTQEWIVLEEFLGGANIAGGAMKATGTDHWDPPNTGASNSSGFTALAAGEYDTPNLLFQLLMRYAVYWTSTEISDTKARERFLSYNSAACDIYDWYKSLNYSIRCVKDETTGMGENQAPSLHLYPNPASRVLRISMPGMTEVGIVTVFDTRGSQVLQESFTDISGHIVEISTLKQGLYVLSIQTDSGHYQKKFQKSQD